jgi:hypothetical protein
VRGENLLNSLRHRQNSGIFRGVTELASVKSSDYGRSYASVFLAYALDTLIVYICALQVSETLVFRFFAWIAPPLSISIAGSPGDWYLRHLEAVTILPALVAGYINVGRFAPALLGKAVNQSRPAYAAVWAWTIPTMILIWRMLEYRNPAASVLVGNHASALRYFFEIQQTMPTWSNFFSLYTEQVSAQITTTAPFYAGVAYSLGAVTAKYRGVEKFLAFLRPAPISE